MSHGTETIRRSRAAKERVGDNRDSDYGAGRFNKATTAARSLDSDDG